MGVITNPVKILFFCGYWKSKLKKKTFKVHVVFCKLLDRVLLPWMEGALRRA